ncbi:hypothetical protein [Zhihengliuella flava]|uniref:Cell division septum initiation protein DivIVA n=1 Tax=Zhihengliuella flava TaxID=1285193 RepID=A0A931DBK6_9MICC|nr:hypothetical protein [Zhihengliuella flava]MBG6085806.1 cell division septum initiation protein DivIVA [Zhihengliuella flava]MBG6085884.1 cell division septum initiation protein DivIVA [Zhihengliuella flava]
MSNRPYLRRKRDPLVEILSDQAKLRRDISHASNLQHGSVSMDDPENPGTEIHVTVPELVEKDAAQGAVLDDHANELAAQAGQLGDQSDRITEVDNRLTQADEQINTELTQAQSDITEAFGLANTANSTANAAATAASDAQTAADAAQSYAEGQVTALIERGRNLAVNPGFEQGDPSDPALAPGWALTNGSYRQAATFIDGSFLAVMPGEAAAGANPHAWNTFQTLEPGHTYRVRVAARRTIAGDNDATAAVNFISAQGSQGSTNGSVHDGWAGNTFTADTVRPLSADITVGPDVTWGRFGVRVIAGAGRFQIDRFEVYDITEAKEALDAAAAAQQAAQDAQTAAGSAQDTADLALSSANGKNKIHRDTSAPSGSGSTPGDIWWQFDSTSWTKIVGQWTWDGSSWVKGTLEHQMISSVDLGSLTVVGQSTLADVVAEEIAARTGRFMKLYAEQLLVAAGPNQIIDPTFSDQTTRDRLGDGHNGRSGVAHVQGSWGTNNAGQNRFGSANQDTTSLKRFWYSLDDGPDGEGLRTRRFMAPTNPGEPWRTAVRVNTGNGTAKINLACRYADGSEGMLHSSNSDARSVDATGEDAPAWRGGGSNIWLYYEHVIPDSDTNPVTHVAPVIEFSGDANEAVVHAGGSMVRMTDGAIVTPGAVKARAVDALSIWADAAWLTALEGSSARFYKQDGTRETIVNGDGIAIIDQLADGSYESLIALLGSGTQRLGIRNTQNDGGDVVIDDAGGIAAASVAAGEVTVNGEDIYELIDSRARGIIARLDRTNNTGANPSTSSNHNQSVMRLEYTARPGYVYEIQANGLRATSAGTNSRARFRLAATTTGTLADTSAPIRAEAITGARPSASSQLPSTDLRWVFRNDSERTVSVIVYYSAFGGADNVLINPTNAAPFTLTVAEHPLTGVSGRADFVGTTSAGSSEPPPTSADRQVTQTWAATGFRSWQGNDSQYTAGGNYLYQGYTSYDPGGGTKKSHAIFGAGDKGETIATAMADASSIVKLEVYLYFDHWYSGAGGTARLYRHGSTSLSSFPASSLLKEVSWKRGEGKWVTITNSSDISAMLSGNFRGLALYTGSTSSTYYGYARGTGSLRPKIRVTYMTDA